MRLHPAGSQHMYVFTYTNKSATVVNIPKLLSVAARAGCTVCESTAAMLVGKIKDPFKFPAIWKATQRSSSVAASLLSCLQPLRRKIKCLAGNTEFPTIIF